MTRAEPLVATITLATDGIPGPTLAEVLTPLRVRLADRAATALMRLEPPRLTLDLTLRGSSVEDGLADAQNAVAGAVAALTDLLGAGHGCTVMTVTVETSAARQERQAADDEARDVVGVAEIVKLRSDMLGRAIAPQSVSRTTQRAEFPAPVQVLASGPIYPRAAVHDFFLQEDARVRPRGSTEPAGITPGLHHRQALAGLLAGVTASGTILPPALTGLADRPHAILGPVLPQVITALGGAPAVAAQLGVSPRTVQRWGAGARQALPLSEPAS